MMIPQYGPQFGIPQIPTPYAQIPQIQQPMMMPQNPMQKIQMVMQAMQNPIGFITQRFPDIPQNIQNNPSQILQYLQQTRTISNEQIQQADNQMQQIMRQTQWM